MKINKHGQFGPNISHQQSGIILMYEKPTRKSRGCICVSGMADAAVDVEEERVAGLPPVPPALLSDKQLLTGAIGLFTAAEIECYSLV